MKINISDPSFHNKIMSRYLKGKGSLFVFPSMFFLKCTRSCLSRIIDMHVRLNFRIHNKYMDLSSVLLQKFQEMKVIFSWLVPEKHAPREVLYRLNNTMTLSRIRELSGFHEINKISVNATTAIFKTPIFSIVNYHSKKLVSFRKENAVYEKSIFNFPMIINQISNSPTIDAVISARKMNDHVLNYSMTANNSIILQRTVYSQIFNHTQTTTKNLFSSDSAINNIFSNYVQIMRNTIMSSRIVNGRTFYYPLMATANFTQTKPVSYWDSNYLQTVNNVILPGILNKRTLNYQTAAYNFFTSGRTVDNQISNYTQIGNNIFSYPRVFNDFNSLNYLRTKNAQTLYGGNNFTLRFIGKNYNTIFKECTNFWKEKIETNQQIFKFNTKTTAQSDYIKDTHKRIVFFPARSIHFGFATQLKPEVQNGINGSNNNTAGADIVFKKPHSEDKITGEKKLHDEKTISAKISMDKQIKNVSPQMLQGEISSIANKVYKLLERRLSIEKEKRGVHIIG